MSNPILIPINEASALIGKCRRGIYQLIATGEIEARKSGRSTLVVYGSLMRYVDNLPAARIKPYVAKGAEATA